MATNSSGTTAKKQTSRKSTATKATEATQKDLNEQVAAADVAEGSESSLPPLFLFQYQNFFFRLTRRMGAGMDDMARVESMFQALQGLEPAGVAVVFTDNYGAYRIDIEALDENGEVKDTLNFSNLKRQQFGLLELGTDIRLSVDVGSIKPGSQWCQYDIASDPTVWDDEKGQLDGKLVYPILEKHIDSLLSAPIFHKRRIALWRNQIRVETQVTEDSEAVRQLFFQ